MNKNFKSIKVKIIMFLIPMLLIAFTVLSGLGYKFASDSLKASNLNTMAEMTKNVAGRADDEIKSEIKSLQMIASNPIITNQNIPLEEKVEILKPALETIDQLNLSISDKNGNSIDALGNKKGIKTTQSFMKSIKGENSITNPYIDPITSKKVISYSVPIKDSSNNIIGVITSVKDCKDFSGLNDDVSFLKTGSSLIVDSNGNFIVAKDETLVTENKNITTMTSDKGPLDDLNNIGKSMIIGNKSGSGKYSDEGKVKYITYSPIGNTGLSIGLTVEEKDLLSALSSLAIVDTVVTIIMIMIISTMIVMFTIKVINRLLGAKTYVDSIAKGDFYTQISSRYMKSNDEISEICTSVSEAKASVGGMIKSVRDNANIVRAGSSSLTDIAEQLSVLTEEIAASIGEVSTSTNKQSCEFEEISNSLTKFGNEVNGVKENVNSIRHDVSVINDKSLSGTKDIEELNDGIISVNESFEKFSISIEYIQGDMKNVNDIIHIMNGISEQINLLAFNAAIEAASAGEAGRGFNVIASEVRKLSDKSKQSAQNISKIINRLMNVINKLVEESNNMDNQLEKQKNIIYKTSSSFAEIVVLVNEITPNVSDISIAFEDISCNKDFIVETVNQLSEEVKDTSNSLGQVTESSVELAKLAEKVNNSSDVLLYKADDLIEKVKQFRIEKEDINDKLAIDRQGTKLQSAREIEVKQEYNDVRNLDLKLEEDLMALNMISDEELNLEYEIEEVMNLELSLGEKFLDAGISPLENLEADLPTKDFGWGCNKVTQLKGYIKQKEMKEYEEEHKELGAYDIINI